MPTSPQAEPPRPRHPQAATRQGTLPPGPPPARQGAAASARALAPLAGLVLAACLTPPAQAQAPAIDAAQLPCDAPALLAQPPEQLSEQLPRCEKTPAFLLHLGAQRNRQGRYEQAADHLERALLLAPDTPEALLQYAIALAGSGDTLSALHLLADLRQRPDLPAPLRADITAVLASAQARALAPIWARAPGAEAALPVRLSAGLRLGYDNNLQGASRLSGLTLTLPGQSVTLPIEPAQQPRAGAVRQADLRASLQRQQAGGARWGMQAAVQQRDTPALPSAGSSQAEWQFDYTAAPVWTGGDATKNEVPGAPAPATLAPWLGAGVAALRTPGGTRYQGRSLSLGLEHAQGACATRWAADAQMRTLHSSPVLSSRYLGASLQWQCTRAPEGRQWLAVLRAGHDHALDATRPGGDQAQAGLRLHLSTPAPALVRPGALWLLDAEYAYSRDARGYSPLLQDGRLRSTHRLSTRVEWLQPLTPGVQAVVGAEAIVQHSTLALFKMRSQGLWLGLRAQW